MINAEYYKNEILKYINENKTIALNKNNKIITCCGTDCDNCKWFNENKKCECEMFKWLLTEHKEYPQLTRFQYELLKKINKEHGQAWIARNKDNQLRIFITYESPYKSYANDRWVYNVGNLISFPAYLDDFDFIKWKDKEPWEIKDLLENCEIKE